MTEQQFTTEELEQEKWKDVIGYEARYEVSSLGRIRRKPRLLNPFVDRYAYVTLRRHSKDKQKKMMVHQIVAAAFATPRDNAPYVNHKDGVKTNNRASNLEYVTPAENSRHAVDNGLTPRNKRNGRHTKPESFAHMRGQNINTSKLQPADVAAIKERYQAGCKIAQIARDYGVTWAAIKLIIAGKNWKHL